MRLAWHIAKKDLRRMALAVGVWLALILVPTIAFCVVSPAVEGNATSSIDTWSRVSWIWVRLLEGVQVFLGYLLAGSLVLEDPLVGTTSFWGTRPISNARLFAAKLMAAAALFLAAPIAVLTPVWLASGFDAIDLVHAGREFGTRFGIATLFAFLMASVARNLAQFLFFSLVIPAALVAMVLIARPFWQDASMTVRPSRELLVLGGALPVMAVVLTHQFLSRRIARTWAMIACALIGAVVIRWVWPWNIRSETLARDTIAPRAEDRAREIVTAPAFTKFQGNSAPSLLGKTSWRAEGFSVPVYARALDGTFAMRSGGGWENEAGLRTLGFKPATGPLIWQLHQLPWQPIDSAEWQFKGTLEAWSVRTTVLGEMPVRLGAELRHGATRVRIIGLVSHDERILNIYLQERDAQANTAGRWTRDWSLREGGRARYIDRYFLVSRAAKQAQPGSPGELGAIEMNSLVIRFLDVGVNWPQSRGETVLVKVRFERDHAFDLPFEVRGVSSQGARQIP